MKKAGGARCTGVVSGVADGRADLSAGHFLVQHHYKSVDTKWNFNKTIYFQYLIYNVSV